MYMYLYMYQDTKYIPNIFATRNKVNLNKKS